MHRARRMLLFTLALAAALVLPGCNVTSPSVRSDVSDLRAEQSDEGGIRLTWDESQRGVARAFVVYRDGRELARVDAPTRTYLDKNVQPDRAYEYTVVGIDADGRITGQQSAPVTFTFRQFISFSQDERINRGYANLTVLARSPGMHWSALSVSLGGVALPKSPSGFVVNGTWTHTSPRDDLVDLGEKLQILARGLVKRNGTLTVELGAGKTLFNAPLEGRPTINMTLRQDRNATGGRVTLNTVQVNWVDNGQPVKSTNANLQPRWADLEFYVNGKFLAYDEFLRNNTWSYDNTRDTVIRPGTSITLRTDATILRKDARVTVFDAGAQEVSAYIVLR